MRLKTATERYNAVLEGKMAEREFVRQMRQEFPNFVSQFNGYNDTVAILKNKGLIFEAKKKNDVAVKTNYTSLPYSLDALERGIRIELEAAGLMPHEPLKAEDFYSAEKKAKNNLEKNPTHYLDLISGESNKVDKHDKEVEVKRGEGKTDTFNGMVKANLKEAKQLYKEGRLEDLAEKLGISLERLQSAVEGIRQMEDAVIDEIEDEVGEVMGYTRKSEKEQEPKPSNYTKAEGTPILREVVASAIGKIKEKYEYLPGIDMIIKDFIKTHYNDLMNGADPIEEFEAFVDHNYDLLEKKGKDHDGDGDVDGDDYMAAKDKAIKKAIGKEVEEAKGKDHDGDGDVDKDDYMAAKDKAIKKAMGKSEQLKEAIKGLIRNSLKEEMINEAATNELAKLADTYGGFKGMQVILNDLENIVTDVESYYARTQEKLQSVFNKVGQVENEEGLKVGGFLAPAIESAFIKDLRPVQRRGFMNGVEIPKVKFMPKDVPTPQMEEEPKQTIFGVNEEKK